MQAQERRKSMGRCLLEAAKNGQLETMKYLLNEGAPVNFQDQVFQQHKKCSNSFGEERGGNFCLGKGKTIHNNNGNKLSEVND